MCRPLHAGDEQFEETAVDNEAGEKAPENPAERRQRLEKSLELGLEDSFPGSDAINIVAAGPVRIGPEEAKAGKQAGLPANPDTACRRSRPAAAFIMVGNLPIFFSEFVARKALSCRQAYVEIVCVRG